MKLEGANVLITGASGDLGRALVEAFVAGGAEVGGLSWSREAPDLCRKKWRADLGSPEEAEKIFDQIDKDWEGVDVLVNNAGLAGDQLLLKSRGEDWDKMLAIHLQAAVLCSRRVLPAMMRKKCGVILNISSLAVRRSEEGQGIYAGAKAGLEAMTRVLAREVGKKGIRVNALAPGFLEGSWLRKYDEKRRAELTGKIPLQRLGRPEEVAAAAVFLASPAAAYITGQVWGVDGGAGI